MRAITVLPLLGLLGLSAFAQPDRSPNDTPKSSDSPIEFPNAELARLEIFIGPWSVTESHFNPRGEVIGSAKGTEEIIWMLDYHAIRRSYASSGGSTTFRATGTLTWNAAEKKYHGNWYDNASTLGPTTVKGTWDDATKTMTLDVESTGPDGKAVRHKVVEKFESGEKRTATTYLVDGSNLVKRLEVVYQRTTPCPAKIRTILGG